MNEVKGGPSDFGELIRSRIKRITGDPTPKNILSLTGFAVNTAAL